MCDTYAGPLAPWVAKTPWHVEKGDEGYVIFVKKEEAERFAPDDRWIFPYPKAEIATSHSRTVAVHIARDHNIKIGFVQERVS